MQSALDVGNSNDTNLITAQALREMTITTAALFEKQKASVLDSLMSSMVRIASEIGGNSHGVALSEQFDKTLLEAITKELQDLGYTVTASPTTDSKLGPIVALSVSW